MRLGVLIPTFNSMAYLEECLRSWIEFRKYNTEHQVFIVCLDCKFKGNDDILNNHSTDGTCQLLQKYLSEGKIDVFQMLESGLTEHDVKNRGFSWFLQKNVHGIMLCGTDEVFTLADINVLVTIFKKESLIAYFKVQFKNYVFDKKHYVLDFIVQRLYRVNVGNWKFDGFYYDDDAQYINVGTGEKTSFQNLPSKIVPNLLAKHFSWCDLERSKGKINYHEKHFAHGAGCSYRYNKKENKIEFNPDYYKKTNTVPPEIFEEHHE